MEEEIPLKDSLEWFCNSGISIYLKQLWGAGLCSPSLHCCWDGVWLGAPGCAVKHKIFSGLWNLGPDYSCLKASLVKMLQHWVRIQTALPKCLSCLSLCPFVCSGWSATSPLWLQVLHLSQDIQCSIFRAPNILYVSDGCRKISSCLYFIAVLLFT